MRAARSGASGFDSAMDVTAALSRVIGEDAAARRQVRRRSRAQLPAQCSVEPSEFSADDDGVGEGSVDTAPPVNGRQTKADNEGTPAKNIKTAEFGEPPRTCMSSSRMATKLADAAWAAFWACARLGAAALAWWCSLSLRLQGAVWVPPVPVGGDGRPIDAASRAVAESRVRSLGARWARLRK